LIFSGIEVKAVGLYRRFSGMLWMSFTIDGKQGHESTHTHDLKLAKKILAIRMTEIAEGRWSLPSSHPPTLKAWATQFIASIPNANTRTRYLLSVNHLVDFFGENARLSDVASVRRIEEFKRKRLSTGIKAATVNRDLAVLRRMLVLATRQRLIARNPFIEVEMLEERKARRRPYILSYAEQKKLIAVASPHLCSLIILLTETGLRVDKEALQLRWADIDFENSQLVVRNSKTLAGRRNVPLSGLCRAEMLRWKQMMGPEFSDFVFPNPKTPNKPLKSVRKAWSTALKRADISFFPIYNLRHCFATRLAAVGTSPIVVAHLLGHSNTSIVMTYAKANDAAHREAILKLDEFRRKASETPNGTLVQ
jgi:integrase